MGLQDRTIGTKERKGWLDNRSYTKARDYHWFLVGLRGVLAIEGQCIGLYHCICRGRIMDVDVDDIRSLYI